MQSTYKLLLLLLFAILFNQTAFADPLMLTPAEMSKLKKYFPADDNTHYVWKGNAIEIALPLNQEKRIIFSSKVIPDLKGALTTDQLRMINDDKSLYLSAKKPFSNIRMYVTVEKSNQVILMDLSTDDKATTAAAYVDLPENKQNNSNAQNLTTTIINNNADNTDDSNSSDDPVSDNDNFVTLIRYAWQQLYAPEQYTHNHHNITRAPMHTVWMISNLIYGDKVFAHPIASWTVQSSYVTAIELRNKYPHKTRINLARDICGTWQAASLYPKNILMAGNKQTDNAVFISGFIQAIW